MTALVFIAILAIWSGPLTYFRVVAAKEKAGAGQPWGGVFLGMSWLDAPTPRGRRHARWALAWFLTGPILLFAWLAAGWP
jgi:hypothetical protein